MPDLLILGRGSIGKKHEQNARSLGWNVVTVDPDPKAEAGFCSLADLQDTRPIDLSHVVIATPIQCHMNCLVSALVGRPSHVLIEKPLKTPHVGYDLAQAFSIRKDSTTALWMAFNWRYNSTIQRLKSEIDSGYFGKIEFASLTAREYLPQYLETGVLLESGSHILDTARFLFGELEVQGGYVRKEIASIILTAGETVVSVNINICNDQHYDYQILVQGALSGKYIEVDREEPMHLREMEAFLSDQENLATLEDGLANMKLIEGVLG